MILCTDSRIFPFFTATNIEFLFGSGSVRTHLPPYPVPLRNHTIRASWWSLVIYHRTAGSGLYPSPWSGYDLPVNLCGYSLWSKARFKRTTPRILSHFDVKMGEFVRVIHSCNPSPLRLPREWNRPRAGVLSLHPMRRRPITMN